MSLVICTKQGLGMIDLTRQHFGKFRPRTTVHTHYWHKPAVNAYKCKPPFALVVMGYTFMTMSTVMDMRQWTEV